MDQISNTLYFVVALVILIFAGVGIRALLAWTSKQAWAKNKEVRWALSEIVDLAINFAEGWANRMLKVSPENGKVDSASKLDMAKKALKAELGKLKIELSDIDMERHLESALNRSKPYIEKLASKSESTSIEPKDPGKPS